MKLADGVSTGRNRNLLRAFAPGYFVQRRAARLLPEEGERLATAADLRRLGLS